MSDKKTFYSDTKNKDMPSSNYFGNNSFSGSDMVAIMHITGVNGVTGTYTLGSLQTLSYSTSMQRAPIRSIGNVNAKDYVMGPRTIAGSLVFAVFDKHFAYEAMKEIKGITEEDYHFLADELPPFDITVTFANEYGKMGKLAIYGVRLINEGQVMSINDIFTENTYQYVATDIDYLSDQTTNTSGLIYQPLKPIPKNDNKKEDRDEIIEDKKPQEQDIAVNQTVLVKTTDSYIANGVQSPAKATFDLSKRVEYGEIIIESKEQLVKKFKLTAGVQFPIVFRDIDVGSYSVHYDSGKATSKSTYFLISNKMIDTKKPSAPIITLKEKMPNDTFKIIIETTDTTSLGVQYTMTPEIENSWKPIESVDKTYVVSNLNEYTAYYFRSYNRSFKSEQVLFYADHKKENLFSDFKNFINNNKTYLIAEWPYFNEMWPIVLKEWEMFNHFSISSAFDKIKKQLDLTQKERHEAYIKICDIAAKYEKNYSDYHSQSTNIKAPKIISHAQNIIEFDKNVTKIEYVCLNNGYQETIGKNLFVLANGKYQCKITSKFVGIYHITAYGENNLKSPILVMNLLNSQHAIKQIESEKQDILSIKQQLETTAIKGIHSMEMLNTSSPEKNLVLREINNNSKTLKEGIPEPIILSLSEQEVVISCFVPVSVPSKQYYLCLMATENIGKSELKERVLITRNIFHHTFFKAKSALIKSKRYSLWIEDSNNSIVSKTTGFDFDAEQSKASSLKNAEIISCLKNDYEINYNKQQLSDFVDDALLSESKIHEHIISKAIFATPHTEPNKLSYIYDAITAQLKYNHVPFSLNGIPNLKIDFSKLTLSGYFKTNEYTTAFILEYNSYGKVFDSLTITDDGYFNLSQSSLESDYLYIYFMNSPKTKVSEPILIDVKNRIIKTSLKAEVIFS